ncbi:MAG: anthranilate phosphoribosyltransferase [Acidobacteriota bacterium]|nr:anthranilate phosphoribosyltransferase [Acidobacteriota bacterium]MDQ7087964.1 anthranilate phosphoribosyltransferase [Acidobacteriota bacterium]
MTELLEQLLGGRDLGESQATALMKALASGELEPALAGALLAALRLKGESAEEVRGFSRALRELARRPEVERGEGLVDVVGTGGDGSGSFNISTGTALLAAACSLRVVKHGNRAVSSRSGSADLLEALGLRLPLDAAAAGRCLEQAGFTFLFAPWYHPAMRSVVPIRRAMGVRTVFNILGPLVNPAEPDFALVGAWSPEVARLMAQCLAGDTSLRRAFVVHGEPGWDEATPCGEFLLLDVRPGVVSERRCDPLDWGLARCRPEDLAGGDSQANAAALERVFDGETGAHRDALVLGAALVLELTGRENDGRSAVARAAEAIDSGAARRVLARLRAFAAGKSGP